MGAAQSSSHRLYRRAGHIIEGVLLRKAIARGLAVGTQRHTFSILRIKLLHNFCPQQTPCPELGNLHKVVHTNSPEEGKTRREIVDLQTGSNTGTDVFQPVGQSVGQLKVGGCTSFVHMITTDADAVEPRHISRRVCKNITDNAHTWSRRVDVRITHHKLLQDVILDRTAQLCGRNPLLFGRHNVEGHYRNNRPIHRHRNRHLIQRYLIEQHLHVFHRIDGNTGLSHIAPNSLMVTIVPPVRSQVKSYT